MVRHVRRRLPEARRTRLLTMKPVVRISKHCWTVWLRFDRKSLEAFVKTHKLIVRVPVERQKKPKGTMD